MINDLIVVVVLVVYLSDYTLNLPEHSSATASFLGKLHVVTLVQ
jgi:hypothetical protein